MAPSSSNEAGTVTASTLVGPSTNKLATTKKPSKRSAAVSSSLVDANGVPGSQNRKRKFTVEERREHSVIEKKRRENLNEKLLILARNLPTLNDKEHKRLSKNIIVTHAISHVQTVQALFRAALPQLRDLLEEHDQMHMELDRMRINAGLKPHPRDREDEHHIRELFQVDGWKYASFPNGFQGEKGDGHEEEDEAASAQKQELPTLKLTEEVEAVPQPTPQINNPSLTIPANDTPLEPQAHAHAQAPLPVYDDSAFLMNNFQFLDQHRRPYQPEEEPLHRPAVDQPRQPTHARQPYYDEMFSLAGHARGVDGSLTYNAGGPADSTAGGQPTFDQTGTEDLRPPQLPQDLTAFMSSFNDSGYPQFPTSTSNLDFLLHWPTGAVAVDHGSIAATTSTPSLSEPGASHTPASTSASSPHVPYSHPSRLHAPVPTYLHRQHDGYDYPPHRGG